MHVSSLLMGVLVLSVGTSVPDAIGSILAAKVCVCANPISFTILHDASNQKHHPKKNSHDAEQNPISWSC
jgi:hypothetical protein